MAEQSSVRAQFMEQFILALVVQTRKKMLINSPFTPEIKKVKQNILTPSSQEKKTTQPIIKENKPEGNFEKVGLLINPKVVQWQEQGKTPVSQVQRSASSLQMQQVNRRIPVQTRKTVSANAQPISLVAPLPVPSAQTTPKIELESLNKINSFLNDQTVSSVECPGPDKTLMIMQRGSVKTTQQKLSKEEIEAIVKEASQKTRIPLPISGIFTAALGDRILTAVLSEFTGTRFIIQKKQDMQRQEGFYTR